jgi:hypothetical protein
MAKSAAVRRLRRLARRGRPKLLGVAREPSGRPARRFLAPPTAKNENSVSVALETRMRLYGLPKALAGQHEAGSVVGRLVQIEVLRPHHLEAANQFLQTLNAYQRALDGKTIFKQHRSEAESGISYEQFCRRARDSYEEMKVVLDKLHAPNSRLLTTWLALELFVVRDMAAYELLPALIIALDALVQHFGIPKDLTAQKEGDFLPSPQLSISAPTPPPPASAGVVV